ncbi:MAG: DUF3179 domain-containing protein, partial [candidate division Zixibacteria bacterium]|nr:DUF3179 domain-containing protein [candidate division Zixibacteria bacterium]
CIQGELKGKVLEPFSSIHTTYAEFKELYPDGLLLKKPQKGPKGSPYEGYFADPDKLGIFGRQDDFRKLDGKDLVFGLRLDGKQVAISRDYIAEKQYVLIEHDGAPILVYYDGTSNTVAAYNLNGDNELSAGVEFGNEKIILNDMAWDARTGEALSANTADLRHFPIFTAYWFAWFSFYPETELKK